MDLRKSFDMTPWDSSGSSFNGLTRSQSKWLALIFIFVGLMFLSPPFDPIPNDWMNFMLAGWLITIIPINYGLMLLLTYVLVGPAIFLFGLWIYPHNTRSLFNGYINKAQMYLKRAVSKPSNILIGTIIFIIMYNLYKGWLL